MADSLNHSLAAKIAETKALCTTATEAGLLAIVATDSLASLFAQKELDRRREEATPEIVCEGCEEPMPDEALNDDGYCADCQLHRDIQRAENLRDSAGDR